MIITPELEVEVPSTEPVVFLAGPIQGSEDWQEYAGGLLSSKGFCVANPRRKTFPPGSFDRQVYWETKWLRRAAAFGRIFFYLCEEGTHDCSRAYAQTTRFELGEWLSTKPECVIVAYDEGFPGLKYIKSRIDQSYPVVPYYDSLVAGLTRVANEMTLIKHFQN